MGEIPIDLSVREGSDLGKPIVVAYPEHPVSQSFLSLAKQVAAQISIQDLSPVDKEELETMPTLKL